MKQEEHIMVYGLWFDIVPMMHRMYSESDGVPHCQHHSQRVRQSSFRTTTCGLRSMLDNYPLAYLHRDGKAMVSQGYYLQMMAFRYHSNMPYLFQFTDIINRNYIGFP